MKSSVGIAGAGLAGRLLALELIERGYAVTLFDAAADDTGCAAYAAAGMLSPSCELETAEPGIAVLGRASLKHWDRLHQMLDGAFHYAKSGSLVIAHPRDDQELRRLQSRVAQHEGNATALQVLDADGVCDLEPALERRFHRGLFFPDEAHLDNRALLTTLRQALETRGAVWRAGTAVADVHPHEIVPASGEPERFEWAVDCRGLGARSAFPDLRGVRGELVHLYAPDVQLTRPVRLMHPRYPLYIVPRPDHRYVVGATTIESDDRGPITVRSTLELLSAAYSVHSGFAEARVLETITQCRPAFPDHMPRIVCGDGSLAINGLYRHGFLIGPALIEYALQYMESGSVPAEATPFMRSEVT